MCEGNSHDMIVWWSNEEHAYLVDVPDLPGCTSRGRTRVEAIQSAEQALETWSRNTAPVGMAALMHRETGN